MDVIEDATTKGTPSQLRLVKNLIVLSFSFMLISSSIDGLQILQSTLNRTEGLGVASIAVQFGFGCTAALFLIKYSLLKFGAKTVLTASFFLHIPSTVANFYPRWGTMVPCYALLGMASTLSWGANSAYLNGISGLYSAQKSGSKHGGKSTSEKLNSENAIPLSSTPQTCSSIAISKNKFKVRHSSKEEKAVDKDRVYVNEFAVSSFQESKNLFLHCESTTARFFGFHSMLYQSGHIWINIMSYLILEKDVHDTNFHHGANCLCGANFCNVESECFEDNLKEPGIYIKHILLTIFLVLNALAAVLIGFFLDPLEKKESNVHYSIDYFLATLKQLKELKQLLLVPLSMYIGMLTSYFYGDFPKAYIGCAWGIYHVGYVTVCYGVTSSIMSVICGWLVKHFGRTALFLGAAFVNAAMLTIMLLWQPNADQPVMFFVISGMWGFVIGCYWAQLKGFHGLMFGSNEEAAFSCFELCFSIACCMSWAYSNHLCINVKLYILLVVSTLGIIGYLLVVRMETTKKFKQIF